MSVLHSTFFLLRTLFRIGDLDAPDHSFHRSLRVAGGPRTLN